MKNTVILNTGGTFNKIYNELSGNLVFSNTPNIHINKILISTFKRNIDDISWLEVSTLFSKDSLEISSFDIDKICNFVSSLECKNIIIIHGTDTIDKTALKLSKVFLSKQIIFVGSMVPFSFNNIEASFNLGMALGFIESNFSDGVYISMNGIIKEFDKIEKDRDNGYFKIKG